MKKVSLPSPPQPSFAEGLTLNSSFSSRTQKAKSESKSMAPLDAAFLERTARTTLWFGAFLTLCLGIIARSLPTTLSFGAGALLSLAMLKSQQMFVSRLAKLKQFVPSNWLMRAPLAFLLPVKYVVIAVCIYFGLRLQLLIPTAFAAGVTTLQIVIFLKLIGRLITHNQKPLREVYISNEK